MWIWLVLEHGGTPYTTYRVVLTDPEGNVVLDRDGLEPTSYGSPVLNLHSSRLEPGIYRVNLEGRIPGGRSRPAAELLFQILP